MNNWIGSMGCSRQTGFVLPVALLLLVVLTVAAVASMRGTTMQERMAVGQVQMHRTACLGRRSLHSRAVC
jgi:Tfp pilus assembly protein PilX